MEKTEKVPSSLEALTAETILACNSPKDLFSSPEKIKDEYQALYDLWYPKQLLWAKAPW